MREDINDIIAIGEGYHTEFKRSLEKSIIEEVCAFANSDGGKILLGVDDKGVITGCDTSNKTRSHIQDILTALQPKLNIKIEVVENIIVVEVPKGNDKPYGSPKGFFIRIGANTQKLERNEIIEFFQKEGKIRFDELVNEKAIFEEDFDQKAYEYFIRLANITQTLSQKKVLQNLDCITEEGKLTNLGVLFFARDIDFLLNHATVVCVLFRSDSRVDILDKKDFKGNMIDNIENAITFVKRNTRLEYEIKTTRRKEIPQFPEVAIREAIINAVCHRDYFDKRVNVVIEVFPRKIVILNPGGLPSGLHHEEFGTKSVPRNPRIASLLQRCDYIEKVGTGITRIQEAVKKDGRCELTIKYDEFYRVEFTQKFPEKFTEKFTETREESENTRVEVGDRVGDRVGDKVGEEEKSSQKSSQKILEAIKENSSITIEELSQKVGITDRAIKKNIAKLKEENKIKRIGSDRSGYWEIVE